ncbi:MAG: cbb3-type cytochrome oxidase assembly protein CcoS [Phycisphaerae bacterium]|nr:cbb3-type cytochrome oxidase assembly protein CcoS [Phycisphaerae bacterium]
MSVIYIVLPLAVIFAGIAVGAFIWAAHQGEFDDLDTPAVRILHDDVDADTVSSSPPRAARAESD